MQTKHLFLLYKTSKISWRNGNSECFIKCNVLQYSFILFSKNVSYFLPFVLYIFLLEWSCRANKAALFFTYSHINLLFKNCFFHLSHFDSLSLQITIKKTFSKCLTLFFCHTLIFLKCILCSDVRGITIIYLGEQNKIQWKSNFSNNTEVLLAKHILRTPF